MGHDKGSRSACRAVSNARTNSRACSRLAQEVGINKTARKQERVVILRVRFVERLVDADAVRRLVQIDATNPAVPDGNDVDTRARQPERIHRDGKFDFLATICRERGNAAAF